MTISKRLRKLLKKNETPLHIAADCNSKEMVELLIAQGAEINAQAINSQNLIILL